VKFIDFVSSISKNTTNFYFYCCIEGDLIILSSFSILLKEFNPKISTYLIIPRHPRIVDRFHIYKIFFDKIYLTKFVSFRNNFILGFLEISMLIKTLKNIFKNEKGVFVNITPYELNDIIIDHYVDKIRLTKITISAFDRNERISQFLQLCYLATLKKTIYSLFFTQKLYAEYKSQKHFSRGVINYKSKAEYVLKIGNSVPRTSSRLTVSIDYPLKYNSHMKELNNIPIIIILMTQYSLSKNIESYNLFIDFIDTLQKKFIGKIYLKDHPLSKNADYLNFEKMKNIQIIDNKESIEYFYAKFQDCIIAVFGQSSTGLITASYLDIPAYNISNLLGNNFREHSQSRIHMQLSDNIIYINSIHELSNLI